MERKTCPFLGLPDDASTHVDFPSEGNFCHKASPVSQVRQEYQAAVCLDGRHTDCPVFQARAAAALPAELTPAQTWCERTHLKKVLPVLAVLALVLALSGAWLGGTRLAGRTAELADLSASSGFPGAASPWDLLAHPAPRQAHKQPPQAVPQSAWDGSNSCPFPRDYVSYTVQPTDSLFRLSVLFQVSEEVLRNANCLDSQTVLSPGMVLYVPTRTLAVSPTATVFPTPGPFFANVNSPSSGSSDEEEESPPAVVPPTEEPASQPVRAPKDKDNDDEEKDEKEKDKDKDKKKDKGKSGGG